MATIPPLEELLEKYGDLLEENEVRELSYWALINDDGPCDEEQYLTQAEDRFDDLQEKIAGALGA